MHSPRASKKFAPVEVVAPCRRGLFWCFFGKQLVWFSFYRLRRGQVTAAVLVPLSVFLRLSRQPENCLSRTYLCLWKGRLFPCKRVQVRSWLTRQTVTLDDALHGARSVASRPLGFACESLWFRRPRCPSSLQCTAEVYLKRVILFASRPFLPPETPPPLNMYLSLWYRARTVLSVIYEAFRDTDMAT